MKIKRIFITLCAACAVSMASFAQTARQVLDQTASKLKNSGGIEASFEGTQFKGTHETGTANGHIQVQGNKFKIASNALTTWFDGRTQWTLMNGSDEVNVSNPTAAELQQVNPYTRLSTFTRAAITSNSPTRLTTARHATRCVCKHKSTPMAFNWSLPLLTNIRSCPTPFV